MNIISIETKKYKNTNFKLAIVESIKPNEEFIQILRRNSLGRYQLLTDVIDTDGNIHVIVEQIKDEYKKVYFKLVSANWFLKRENNSVELYIVDGYTAPIHIKENYLNNIVANGYKHCLERINHKREYARQINEKARKLNLPFNLVLAFKGEEESIKQYILALTKLLKRKYMFNLGIIRKLNSNSYESKCKALKKLNIPFPRKSKPVEDISKYALACLSSKRILLFGEH